jgi:hypothetical protein
MPHETGSSGVALASRRTGCHFIASLRYAFLSSSSVAFLGQLRERVSGAAHVALLPREQAGHTRACHSSLLSRRRRRGPPWLQPQTVPPLLNARCRRDRAPGASCDARTRRLPRYALAALAGVNRAGSVARVWPLSRKSCFCALRLADVAALTRRRFIPSLSMEGPATMNSTVCPCGGFHEFEPVKGENDFVAGILAGACSTCLFCIWWPLLLCGAWLSVSKCRACAACAVVLAPALSPNQRACEPTARAAARPRPACRRFRGVPTPDARARAPPRSAGVLLRAWLRSACVAPALTRLDSRVAARRAGASCPRTCPTSSAPSVSCWWTARDR